MHSISGNRTTALIQTPSSPLHFLLPVSINKIICKDYGALIEIKSTIGPGRITWAPCQPFSIVIVIWADEITIDIWNVFSSMTGFFPVPECDLYGGQCPGRVREQCPEIRFYKDSRDFTTRPFNFTETNSIASGNKILKSVCP